MVFRNFIFFLLIEFILSLRFLQNSEGPPQCSTTVTSMCQCNSSYSPSGCVTLCSDTVTTNCGCTELYQPTGCLEPSGSTSTPSGSTTTTASVGITCGITKAAMSITYTVVIDDDAGSKTGYPGGYRQIKSNGCPGYDWTSETTPNNAEQQNLDFKLPLQPKIVTTTPFYTGIEGENGAPITDTVKGQIGISINGVAIYGNSDKDNRDAYKNESVSFDFCGGHSDQSSTYHYHENPKPGCVLTDTVGQHSQLFGFMIDGIPIYGELGDNGEYPTDLDSCGGHFDNTHPFYHYHFPKNRAFPYTVNCLVGCIYKDNGTNQYSQGFAPCSLSTTQYDYSSINNSGLIQNAIATSTFSDLKHIGINLILIIIGIILY